MSDIKANLRKILEAVYGEEVRGAIHDAIHNCYEDGRAGTTDLIARERIDNLAKLEDGSTTGDAELIDIRVGYNGVEYDNAGTSVRTQIQELADKIFHNDVYENIGNVQKGAINTETGGNTTASQYFTTRRRTNDYIKYTKGSVITCTSDYNMKVFIYDENNILIDKTKYIGSSYIFDDTYLPEGCVFRVMWLKVDETDFDDDEFPVLTFSMKKDGLKEIDDKFSNIIYPSLFDTNGAVNIQTENGSITQSGGNTTDGQVYDITRRRTSNFIKADLGSLITCNSDYTMAIKAYSRQTYGSVKEGSDWVGNKYELEYDEGYIRVVLKRLDGADFGENEYPIITIVANENKINKLQEKITKYNLKKLNDDFIYENNAYKRTGGYVGENNKKYYLLCTTFVPQDVKYITINDNNYRFTLWAFDDEGERTGFMTDDYEFTDVSSSPVIWLEQIDMDKLREIYPTYNYQLEICDVNTANGVNTIITPSEASAIDYYCGDEQIQKYYDVEVDTTENAIRECITEPALVFPLITDIHYLSVNNLFNYSIKNIKELSKRIKYDFVLNLGDNTDGDTATNITIARNYHMLKKFQEIDVPYYFAIGNHDTNYFHGATLLDGDEIFKTYLENTRGVKFDLTDGENNYYKDFDELGVRLIVLDADHNNKYIFSSRTATWLSDVALDTEHIVLLCLHLSPIATQNWNAQALTNGEAVKNALQEFVDNGGTLVQLCGHSHADYNFITPWLTIYSNCGKFEHQDTSVGGFTKIVGNDGEIISPERKLGTSTEDSWSVVIFKPISRTIDLIRFGAGDDRHFSF